MIRTNTKTLTALALLIFIIAAYAAFHRSLNNELVVTLTQPKISAIEVATHKSTNAIDSNMELSPVATKHESFSGRETSRQLQVLAPDSLTDIAPPALHWDADGSLSTNYNTRAWFEFFRSVPSEEYSQSKNYKLAILQEMPEEQRLQILALENQYHQLLDAEFQLRQEYSAYGVEAELQHAMQGQSGDQDAWQKAQEMFAQRQQLRRELLGEALTEAWYDQDEAMENYTMSALSIARDPSLDESSKAMKVTQLDYMLPAEVQETVAISRQSAELAMAVTQWQNDGWSEKEIEDAITMQYGSDIAKRWNEAGNDNL